MIDFNHFKIELNIVLIKKNTKMNLLQKKVYNNKLQYNKHTQRAI